MRFDLSTPLKLISSTAFALCLAVPASAQTGSAPPNRQPTPYEKLKVAEKHAELAEQGNKDKIDAQTTGTILTFFTKGMRPIIDCTPEGLTPREGPPTMEIDTSEANQVPCDNADAIELEAKNFPGQKKRCFNKNRCVRGTVDEGGINYSAMQSQASDTAGGFMGGGALFKDEVTHESGTELIFQQDAQLAISCDDREVHEVAGIAFKATGCNMYPNGTALLTFKICTAPARGHPVKPQSSNLPTRICGDDPTKDDYFAPPGYQCYRPSCDTEPAGSRNGWSHQKSVRFDSRGSRGPSAEAKVVYPDTNNPAQMTEYLKNKQPGDAEEMTYVTIRMGKYNPDTGKGALGVYIAYRGQSRMTEEMLVNKGVMAGFDPKKNTAAWNTIKILSDDKVFLRESSLHQDQSGQIATLGKEYGKNGMECIQRMLDGLTPTGEGGGGGEVWVCDPKYTNYLGIKPDALSAVITTDASEECGSVTECLTTVVNTNTWTSTCDVDVPLSIKSCTTTQDYTINSINATRTRPRYLCKIINNKIERSCAMTASIGTCNTIVDKLAPENLNIKNGIPSSGGVIMVGENDAGRLFDITSQQPDNVKTMLVNNHAHRFKFMPGNPNNIYQNWLPPGYHRLTLRLNVKNKSEVKLFKLVAVGFDDSLAIRFRGSWIYDEWTMLEIQGKPKGTYFPEHDKWGVICPTSAYGSVGDLCVGDVAKADPGLTKPRVGDFVPLSENSRYYHSSNVSNDANIIPNLDKDLLGSIQNGENKLEVDVGVLGNGNMILIFDASIYTKKCEYKFDNGCEALEAKPTKPTNK